MAENINDDLVYKTSEAFLTDGPARNNLTNGIYLPNDETQHISRLEHAFQVISRSENSERKIRDAIRKKQLPKAKVRFVIDEALSKDIISQTEYDELKESAELRLDANTCGLFHSGGIPQSLDLIIIHISFLKIDF